MRSPDTRRRRAARLVVAVSLVVTAIVTARPGAESAVTAQAFDPGGEYHPIAPETLLAATSQSVSTDSRLELDSLALVGVPDDPAHVRAVLVNISVWGSDVNGELVAFNAGRASATRTSLTFSRRRPTSGLVVVDVRATGKLALSLRPRDASAGVAKVRAVVVGWFSSSSALESGSRLVTQPMRDLFADRLEKGESVTVPVRGRAGVPRGSSVEAVLVSITVRKTTAAGFVSVATDAVQARDRSVSTLMLKRREKGSANLALVPVAPDGSVTLHSDAGRVDVSLHVVGYTTTAFDPASSTGRLESLDRPSRELDTTASPSRPLGPGQAERWYFERWVRDLGRGQVQALVGTITGHSHRRQYPLSPASTTELRIYPEGSSLPKGANLLLGEVQRRSNTVVATLSDNDVVMVYNRDGTTHYNMDVSAVILG